MVHHTKAHEPSESQRRTDGDESFSANIAKSAHKNNTTLKEEALKTGLIDEKDYDKIVSPKKMIYPA